MTFKTESVSRIIAWWGSIVAAIMFGVAFIIDKEMSWDIVSSHAVHIGLIVSIFAIFGGYALASSKRFELLGSVIAFASIFAVYVICWVTNNMPPNLIFLVVGAPALFHLVAVVHHFHSLPRVQASGRLATQKRAVAWGRFIDIAPTKANS
jgi:hypothetical protein